MKAEWEGFMQAPGIPRQAVAPKGNSAGQIQQCKNSMRALVQGLGYRCHVHEPPAMAPGVVNVGHDLGDLQVGKGGNTRHGLDELNAVHDKRSRDTVTDQAGYRLKIIVHII